MTKYYSRPTTVDNVKFHSQKEARRYSDLKVLLRAGRIKDLRLQPRFPLVVKNKLICTYVADFEYYDHQKADWIVEDAKGVRTREYQFKRKLFETLYPWKILET